MAARSIYFRYDFPETIDSILVNLKHHISTVAGHSDNTKQYHSLARSLKRHSSDGERLSFDEVQSAFSSLNFIHRAKDLAVLIDRYDSDGSGYLHADSFARKVAGLLPDENRTAAVRQSFTVLRQALRKAGGLHGVREFTDGLALIGAATGGLLGRSDFSRWLREYGAAALSQRELAVFFSEFDPEGVDRMAVQHLIQAIRGPLPRLRREMLLRLWEGQLAGEDVEVLPLEGLLASAQVTGSTAQLLGVVS